MKRQYLIMEWLSTMFLTIVFAGDAESSMQSVTVLLHENVRLNCSTAENSSAYWERSLLGSYETTCDLSWKDRVVENFQDRMSIVTDRPGQYDLILYRTEHTDAGVYMCKSLGEHNDVMNTIELAVLDFVPRCDWNTSADWIMEGVDVLMTCNVSYSSNTSFVIRWNGFPDPTPPCRDSQHSFVRTCTVSDVIHSSNISTVQSSCSMSVIMSDARTVVHRSRCNYERNISVHFIPRNIKYHPIKDSYEVGDVITCSVESEPPAKYTWFNNNSDVVSNGSSVTVGSDMGWIRCFALNVHGNTSITFNVTKLEGAMGGLDIYWIAAMITICLALAVICIMCLWNKRGDVATSKVSTMTGMNKPDIVSETPSGSDDRNNENSNDLDSRQQYWNVNDLDAYSVANEYDASEISTVKSLENVLNTTQQGRRTETRPSTQVPTDVVYAKVQKKSRRAETRPSTLVPTDVVYAEVQKNRKKGFIEGNTVTVSAEVHEQTQDDSIQMEDLGRLHSNRPRQSPNVHETIRGDDGTIYTQLGSRAPPRTPRRNQPPRTVPETNEYASVAHNLEIPPPLPPANNR